MIRRIFVEKKKGFDVNALKLKDELAVQFRGLISDVRIFLRYDIEGIEENDFQTAVKTIFSEPPADNVYFEVLPNDINGYEIAAVEYLPGQYDQRADSAAQCVQLLTMKERPNVLCATVYAFKTNGENIDQVLDYLINPVEARRASLEKPMSLMLETGEIKRESSVSGFINFTDKELDDYRIANGFAMSLNDIITVRTHFKKEKRDPMFLELKLLDTYWSDHCRHTTFLTRLENITVESENTHIQNALNEYIALHNELYKDRTDKYHCLMDIATIAVKELKRKGYLNNLDESGEINACSIKVSADINGKKEDWLVMFKNETHNHPTEIEPFGGAATCLGGAIRDPLSGRVYVYQAMRITGAHDPRTPLDKTLKGKLSQRTITRGAASGFSSYGNQIGLATGIVHEMYHKGYVAKRLETGFVVGAAPAKNIHRTEPKPEDVVLLIGGATGRDGCGGATGSSKAHDLKSVETCGAEVQKGNAPVERKLQRLFRNPEFAPLIKKCNDFGAGGVCVAIGELSGGLDIYLDKIPKKYQGLTALELAISESQERMAVVVDKASVSKIKQLCLEENVDCDEVAVVTSNERLRMFYNEQTVADMPRSLVDSNGALGSASAHILEKPTEYLNSPSAEIENELANGNYALALKKELGRLEVCSQKGLSEMFDSTVGGNTILMPFGNDEQLTPAVAMASKLPVQNGDTNTATIASFGCNINLLEKSPFIGAVYSVLMSAIKAVIVGADYDSIKLTFQEYFMRLKDDPRRWGVPVSALLGAFKAQIALKLASIGGKDSMSGTFEDIDVPPTLISFALGLGTADGIITNCLREKGKKLYLLPIRRDKLSMPDFDYFTALARKLSKEIKAKNIDFATITEEGGAYTSVVKSVLGSNGISVRFLQKDPALFYPRLGDVIISCKDIDAFKEFDCLLLGETYQGDKVCFLDANLSGNTTKHKETLIENSEEIDKSDLTHSYLTQLDAIFPRIKAPVSTDVRTLEFTETANQKLKPRIRTAKPRVLIPVFPGTNCEYETARKFMSAGAEVKTFVFKNLSSSAVTESISSLKKHILNSNIIAFAGGFSAGDEPDGSGKFIATVFLNPEIKEAVDSFLKKDGLIIGICNGFQALIKTGLLPFNELKPLSENSPTLTFNTINRHISTISKIRISSVNSPWLKAVNTGDIFAVPISHGEGRFVCSDSDLERLIKNGQIFSQYADDSGNATILPPFNPNGSLCAVEGIISADGRILGKMGHSERTGKNLMKNIYLKSDMKLFESGTEYFS